MPRFFIAGSDAFRENDTFPIVGEDALHITRSLRMRLGEKLTVCDEGGVEYDTEIYDITGAENVVVKVLSAKKSENEPPYKCTVYQALVKGDRFDTVLQKSVELGAAEIVPVITSRCMVKLEPKDYARKTERWQKIVSEAAKQCGRARIPVVREPVPFEVAVEESAGATLPLFCYEGEGTLPLSRYTSEVREIESAAVMIGPEGGYSSEEALYAKEHGMLMTGLGRRILRTETAPLFVLSCLSLTYEL